MSETLTLIHRDAGLVVVAKPAGPPSTGRTPETSGSVEYALSRQLRQKVWAVHQLDRYTSGCNLFVLKKSLVQTFSEALRCGRKCYVAICHGQTPPDFEVDVSVGRRREVDSNRTFPCLPCPEADLTSMRRALTFFSTLGHSQDGAFSLVLARPATGRTHQIRLHLAFVGHPLVGEDMHRDPACALAERHQLHAMVIDLEAIDDIAAARFSAPLPTDMKAFVERHFALSSGEVLARVVQQLDGEA